MKAKKKPETKLFPSEQEVFEKFIEAWSLVPPLMRAASGAQVIDYLGKVVAERLRAANIQKSHGLERRRQVTLGCTTATMALLDLVVALTRQADDEAERCGVQVDIRESK